MFKSLFFSRVEEVCKFCPAVRFSTGCDVWPDVSDILSHALLCLKARVAHAYESGCTLVQRCDT
jgi:hypothetical protein